MFFYLLSQSALEAVVVVVALQKCRLRNPAKAQLYFIGITGPAVFFPTRFEKRIERSVTTWL